MTRQRTIGPSISTSLTPDARSICRTGGAPAKLTSTRWTGCLAIMFWSLGSTLRAAIGEIPEPALSGAALGS